MNPEHIHDALSLLPNDLLAPVDALRSRPVKRPVFWVRWVSMAACLVLVFSTTLMAYRFLQPKGATEASKAAPPEAPAAAAPLMEPEQAAGEVPAAEEAPAADEAPAVYDDTNAASTAGKASHIHSYADSPETVETPVTGFCGNTTVTIHIGETAHSISGSDAVAITDILVNLRYSSELCHCISEYTVDTETLPGIEINLTAGFARCERGQANLTEDQANTIQHIIDALE